MYVPKEYVTLIIEKFEDIEMATHMIDDLSYKMYTEGYSLVTYQFYDNDENIIITFKLN